MGFGVRLQTVGADDVVDLLLRFAALQPALDDLGPLQPGVLRGTQRPDEEARRTVVAAFEVAAHRHAVLVGRGDRVRCVRHGIIEPETAEEAHADARARGREGLPALQRVEDRGAGVLAGPHRGQTASAVGRLTRGPEVLPAAVLLAVGGTAGLGRVRPPREASVLLVGAGGNVTVARSDRAEGVRVHAQALLHLEPGQQRVPPVAAFEDGDRVRVVHPIQVVLDDLEVGPLVVRRQRRMDLGGALLLADFGHRLVPYPLGRELRVDLRALPGLPVGKGQAVALVHVVGHRQRLDPLLAQPVEPVPEVLGIAVEGTEGQLRRLAAAEDDVPVHVTATHPHRVLVADQGGEPARVVVPFGRLDDPLPGACPHLRAVDRVAGASQFPHPAQRAQPRPGPAALAGDQSVGQRMPIGRAQGIDQRRQGAQILGMIRYREEIERRAGEPDRFTRGVRNRLPPGEAVGVIRGRAHGTHEGVVRVHRVDVQVAEQGDAVGGVSGRDARAARASSAGRILSRRRGAGERGQGESGQTGSGHRHGPSRLSVRAYYVSPNCVRAFTRSF